MAFSSLLSPWVMPLSSERCYGSRFPSYIVRRAPTTLQTQAADSGGGRAYGWCAATYRGRKYSAGQRHHVRRLVCNSSDGTANASAGFPPARQACADDLPHLFALERLTAGGATWSDKQIEAELSRERATVLVVDEGGGPVGWAVGWDVPGELHIMNVAVHPDHRRRGHARSLLRALIERHSGAEVALLEVRASNEGAQALYDSLGFQRVGVRRKYYQDGEDAVLMVLQLETVPELEAA